MLQFLLQLPLQLSCVWCKVCFGFLSLCCCALVSQCVWSGLFFSFPVLELKMLYDLCFLIFSDCSMVAAGLSRVCVWLFRLGYYSKT